MDVARASVLFSECLDWVTERKGKGEDAPPFAEIGKFCISDDLESGVGNCS